MSWKAGQHVYVYGPTISAFPFEAHPFTISSIPNEDKSAATSDVILIIRARDGFTKRLANVAREAGGSADVTVCVEGPYGYVRGLESYGSVIFVAGSLAPFIQPNLSLSTDSLSGALQVDLVSPTRCPF